MTDITEPADTCKEFDYNRSVCILPARTAVLSYLDDNGDLWISTSDAALCIDTEFRIAAEDVWDFVNGLTQLIGIPSVGRPQASPAPKKKTSNAERQRRFREKRNAETVTPNAETVSQSVTCDDQPPLNWGAA